MPYRISVGAIGTLARGVLTDDRGGEVEASSLITPLDPAAGTLSCLGRLADAAQITLPHLLREASTVAIRTDLAREVVATRSGARIGTIATKGFRTRLVFQPVTCSDGADKNSPVGVPVPVFTDGHLMTEVAERVDAQGTVVTPLDEESVVTAVRYLKKQQVESIAVLLLFSPLLPRHEQRVGEIIADEFPGAHVAISSAVLPSLGEFQRWSTTLLGAYVAPKVSSYVAGLSAALAANGFGGELRFAGPEGDGATAEAVVDNPALLLHQNAPVTAQGAALLPVPPLGFRNLLTVDTGETRFRVGFHPGREARQGCDGSPGIGFAVAFADSFWTDVERSETHCPVVVDELRLLEDGEGAGEYRGAPGVCMEVTLRAPLELAADGGDNELLLCGPEGVYRPLRTGRHPALPGDRCLARCRGSEGWGNPLDRGAAKVQQDAIAGYVSVARARDVYGVVLNPSTLELQCDATQRLREARREKVRKRQHTQTAPHAHRSSAKEQLDGGKQR